MRYYLNKKSAVSGFLIMVLIITAGFVVIFFVMPMILGGANIAAADSMCKGSVALRAKSYTEIKTPIVPIKLAEFGTPLLCKTSEFTIPEDKNADKEAIQKELADLIASCWNRYGEGLIENVFKTTGSKAKNRCQVCYIVNLRETSKFQGEPSEEQKLDRNAIFDEAEPIKLEIEKIKIDIRNNKEVETNQRLLKIKEAELVPLQERLEGITKGIGGVYPDEFGDYLFNTPYKLLSESDDCKIDGGFCIKSADKGNCRETGVFPDEEIEEDHIIIDEASSVCGKKGLTSCCYTDYGCLNRGGICNPDPVSPFNVFETELIQQYTKYDDDVWDCPTDEYCFVKNENHYTYGGYVQSFGGEGRTMVLAGISPGETYAISFGGPSDKCGWCDFAKKTGAIAGGAAVLVGGTMLLGGGIIAAPFTFGSSLAITAIGVGVLVGATAGYVAVAGATEAANWAMDLVRILFKDRDMNTVYFTTLTQLQQDGGLCSIIKSV